MSKIRKEYSEDLESQFRRLERAYQKAITNFDRSTISKSSQEMLDPVYDFFTLCYHLREWVEKDKKVQKNIKDTLPSFEDDSLKANDLRIGLQICRDLCNKSKHRKLEKKRKPNDINTKINLVGGAIFKVPIQELELATKEKKTIHIKDEDGIYLGDFTVSFKNNNYDLQSIIKYCMYFWKTFFEENDLIMPRATSCNK